MMHAVASKRRLINVISLSFVSKLFPLKLFQKLKNPEAPDALFNHGFKCLGRTDGWMDGGKVDLFSRATSFN